MFNKKFKIDKIGDTDVYLGPYPQNTEEAQKLKDEGITAVLNIQNDQEINFRQIPNQQIEDFYRKNDMEIIRCPIRNFSEKDLKAQLPHAACLLNDLISNRNKKVFVHCTAGVGRAPSVVLAYLCLYKKVDLWDDVNAVYEFMKFNHIESKPNMKIVSEVVVEGY